jgi:hypothetical protein
MKLYNQWKDAPKKAKGRLDLRNMAIAELLKEKKLSELGIARMFGISLNWIYKLRKRNIVGH